MSSRGHLIRLTAQEIDTDEASVVMCGVRNHVAKQEEAMKWRDLYSGLTICDPADQPDCDIPDCFARMADGAEFALDPFHSVDDEAGNPKTLLRAEQLITVVILQARVTPGCQCLELTCEMVGVLPPGIVHGTYVFKFKDGKYCNELPAGMFEDSEAPEDELSHWYEY